MQRYAFLLLAFMPFFSYALSKRILAQSQLYKEPAGYSPFLCHYDRVISANSKFSWPWGWNDGSHFCRHTVRDNQVRPISFESSALKSHCFQDKAH